MKIGALNVVGALACAGASVAISGQKGEWVVQAFINLTTGFMAIDGLQFIIEDKKGTRAAHVLWTLWLTNRGAAEIVRITSEFPLLGRVVQFGFLAFLLLVCYEDKEGQKYGGRNCLMFGSALAAAAVAMPLARLVTANTQYHK